MAKSMLNTLSKIAGVKRVKKLRGIKKRPKTPSKNNDKNGRKNGDYRLWRKTVYERDNHRCRICGSRGYLNAHHIKGYAAYKSLRYDVNNGVTLCRYCHGKFHNVYGKIGFPDIVALHESGKLELNKINERKKIKLEINFND